MSTPSGEEVPNSISNSTLQAMLAARREGGQERPGHVPNEDPSVQALMVEISAFKRLVESGAISGSKADAWKKAMAEEAEVAALRAKAEGGDVEAMRVLGFSYRDGKRGLKKDATQRELYVVQTGGGPEGSICPHWVWSCLPDRNGRR